MTEPGARPIELLRALAALAEPPAPEHAHLADALALGDPPDGAAYADLFLFGVHPYASVHLGPEGMLGGEARERVAGFWRAVGRTPPPEPDHLSALLALYAGLLDEARDAPAAESEVARLSARALLHEHLAPWVFAFLERATGEAAPFYAAWAELTGAALAHECAWAGEPAALPAHLHTAPGLPDPREDGGEAFLSGLLAPVRSGMILTRSDLVRIARGLDAGARAGERRYVLEHLLGFEPEQVLRALAEHARSAADGHAARRRPLGKVAAWWEERARATADLLDVLGAVGSGTPTGAAPAR